MSADINVLLLEDDQALLQALSEVLEDLGYRVQAIADSQRAVDVSLDQDFDLIITDIRMAGMDGLEALARVREIQPDIRSLVVTGFSSEFDTIRALRLGVGEYLSKPFRMEQFSEAVERLVGQIKKQRASNLQEKSLRQLLVWSMETFAGQRELKERCSWAVEAGRMARQLAQRMQMAGGGEAVQLACLSTVLQPLDLPEFVTESLPRNVKAILQIESGFENSIIESAQQLAQGRPLPDNVPPTLRQAAERLHAGSEEAPAAPAQQRRSTLSLAIALEQAQQMESAIKAYQALVVPPPSLEAVVACQSLAHLAHRLGRPQQVRDYALQAVAISRHLGPMRVAAASCEAGILLASIGAPEASGLLHESEQLCERLDFPARRARLNLAQASLNSQPVPVEALQALLHFGAHDELLQAAWWLTPVLLESIPEQVPDSPKYVLLRKCLERLLADKPGVFHELVVAGRLSPPARLALVQLEPGAETLGQLAQDAEPNVSSAAQRMQGRGQTSPRQPPLLRVFSLGVLEMFFGEERLPDDAFKRNHKARLMLSYLALERGRAVSEEVLVDAFWPDEGGKGRQNLYSIRSIWRKVIQPPGFGQELEYVVRTSAGLMLDPELPWWHDVEELRRCLRNWESLDKSGRSNEALASLRRAAQLYRGPFLETCYLDWAVSLREQTEFQMVQGLLRLAGLVLDQHQALAGGQTGDSLLCSEAQEACQRVLELDSCSQEACRLGMQAFLLSGRPQDAIRLYERCTKVLQREMGAEPSIPVFELYTRARMAL